MIAKSLLAGVATLALVGTAAADTPSGTYIGLAAGANFLEEYDTFAGKYGDWDTGYYVGGVVGYKWDNGFRAEFEASFRENDVDFFFGKAAVFQGTLTNRALSGMVNVLYDLDVGEGMALSLGGGVGASRISFLFDNSGSIGRDVVFAYQGIAEFEAMIDDNVGVYLGYNYFVADNWDIDGAQDDYVAHTVKLGVKYHFYEPEAAPVVVEPPPPPPVAAKTFIVFFNFDKSDLTPEAQAVIAEAAAAFASTGSVSIAVVGHTDTVGSAAYNLPLSQRRAASVKAGLVANGVPGGAISTDGRGFSEPLVATGPGVKEPQNRRATIDLTGSGT
ncbi:MAG: OmpA family protein [Micropepsaceae bacterium]